MQLKNKRIDKNLNLDSIKERIFLKMPTKLILKKSGKKHSQFICTKISKEIKELAHNLCLLRKKDNRWFKVMQKIPGFYQLKPIIQLFKGTLSLEEIYLKIVEQRFDLECPKLPYFNRTLHQLIQQKFLQEKKHSLAKMKLETQSIEKHYKNFAARRNNVSFQRLKKEKIKLFQSVFAITKNRKNIEEYYLNDNLERAQMLFGDFQHLLQITRKQHKYINDLSQKYRQIIKKMYQQINE